MRVRVCAGFAELIGEQMLQRVCLRVGFLLCQRRSKRLREFEWGCDANSECVHNRFTELEPMPKWVSLRICVRDNIGERSHQHYGST